MDKEERNRRLDIIAAMGGILPYHVEFYREAISYAAESARAAFRRFENAHAAGNGRLSFLSLQEALTHAAALSRFFWPPHSKNRLHEMRAQKLRFLYNVGDDSALRERDLRNALEHFDERMDEYLLTAPTGLTVLGPLVENHHIADDPAGSIFRMVDPEAFIFVIFGEKFDFLQIRLEVDRIVGLGRGISDA